VGEVVVIGDCPVVQRVEGEVVRGPAADVQAAIRTATTTTEIGVRIRSSGLGGRWCRLIVVGPGGSTEVEGGPPHAAGCPLDHSDGIPLRTLRRCACAERTPAELGWRWQARATPGPSGTADRG
jgi:hypothetical protein